MSSSGSPLVKHPADSTDYPPGRKRAKYTQVACNECKRRKLKCTGESSCFRCVCNGIQCVYTSSRPLTESSEAKPDSSRKLINHRVNARFQSVDKKMEKLQGEMRSLAARIQELEGKKEKTHEDLSTSYTQIRNDRDPNATPTTAHTASTDPGSALDRIMNPPMSPTFVGPTSAEFGLGHGVVGGSHRASDSDTETWTSDDALETCGEEKPPCASQGEDGLTSPPDSLVGLGLDEALRLVQVYEDTVGVMYPCVDLDSVRGYMRDFYRNHGDPTATAGAVLAGQKKKLPEEADWFFARDVQVLKIILAIALLSESHGRSERAAQLANSVEDKFSTRMKVATVDMKELLILALLSIFHSYRDDEVFAWRLIGMAVRGAMELGLHCQEAWYKYGGVFPGDLQWTWAVQLWWCIYLLDRKWSFGTGLPFAIQDSDMDGNLPEPVRASSPYLKCMISYSRLSTKIWNLVVGWHSRPRAVTTDNCAYLDFQVQQWIQSIPAELRFDPTWRSLAGERPPDSLMTLQVLLALQANQLRILVYRTNLLSAESITADETAASTAVEAAKNTIHMLDYFSRVADIYFHRPEPFNYFLLSALAALFLAVLHAPVRFTHSCRPEFHTAVGMVRRSSTRARTSRRLQKIIRGLKRIRLNLPKQSDMPGSNHYNQSHEHNNNHNDLHIMPEQLIRPSSFSSPISPTAENTCIDLTSFFEMAGEYILDAQPVSGLPHIENTNTPDSLGGRPNLEAFQAEDEALTRVMAGLL
ncbi:hypothetical protein ASPZODRAFT_57563 [Penicilliopsis zonata CBS 506.65]|uniref:Zn(2)-C6 fungal-type domain-containing protein n=1 Tax=Penicilliopsis zonata CBS 506.65 TaxID=1073090 RepID=A0A1L9SWF8_9EURO|nr:hypothetical protein ASPZODRAFT_57563 [Penicilliopsis zonata CBS 506.65]OJJ51535.1 hypothetical protein ASPZODRAFT_57563 [Penicilliopsis zonata CBS 506.65]